MPAEDRDEQFQIHEPTYEWSIRLFRILERLLKVNLRLHQDEGQVRAGEIFLFNHFARFETFIPQYLIFRESGSLCRSLAASDLFAQDTPFSKYLINVGAVPSNYSRLLPFLAAEILRGRKVIIFPEGGMVKDRRVLDSRGRYSVYSRMAGERRKHHSGAAVLALTLDAFKLSVIRADEMGDRRRVETWADALGLHSEEALLEAVRRPTLIVPGNITFYPIRVNDNLLHKGADLLSRGLSRRLAEELLIEGNILLKNTDMDLNLSKPVQPAAHRSWWERKLIAELGRTIDSLDDFFRPTHQGKSRWRTRLITRTMRRKALHIRDEYMYRMYSQVTVNLSHLASRLILTLLDNKQPEIDQALFHKALYLAVKKSRTDPSLNAHRSILNPEAYGGIVEGRCPGLARFFETAISMGLIRQENGRYHFLPKLQEEHELDEIRLENLVAVYANEVAPVPGVNHSVKQAIQEASLLDERKLARMHFDDELAAHAWDRQSFSKPQHQEINRQETATRSGAPFLLLPEPARNLGIVLVHGFLASPAEVRSFGSRLEALGHPVIGVRLRGHGTSPWDLRERSWEDWLEAVRRGYKILSAWVPRVCLVGFSTGGALSLRLAADQPEGLAGVAAIAAPLRFRDRRMVFVPLLHGANRLVSWVSSFEGILPFRLREVEHPHINYRNMPVRGLYELQRMLKDLEDQLPKVQCPVSLIQGSDDPVVDPKSASLIREKLSSARKDVTIVAATRHGILYEDIGGTQEIVLTFLESITV